MQVKQLFLCLAKSYQEKLQKSAFLICFGGFASLFL